MAEVVVLRNPLDISRRRRCHLSDGVALLEWVEREEPAGGHLQRAVYVNGRPLKDPDYRTRPGDEVLVAFAPGAVTAGALILQALVSFAVGFILSKLFAPKRPTAGDTPAPSQVYGIAPPKNAARLGQPIPVLYGSVVALPDFAAQPYTRFNENNDQILYALLCLGQGEYDVSEMLFGQTSAKVVPGDVVSYTVYPPGQHLSTFGVIERFISGFWENVVTSPAVGDQELVAPNMGGVLVYSTWYWHSNGMQTSLSNPGGLNGTSATTPALLLALLPPNPAIGTVAQVSWGFDGTVWRYTVYDARAYTKDQQVGSGSLVPPPVWSGAGQAKVVGSFETCKPGQAGSTLELDFVFPNGLYAADGSGNLADRTVSVQVSYWRLNDDGTDATPETSYVESFTAKQNTPQRYSRAKSLPSGRYRVRVSRATDSDLKVSTSDRIIWAGLKFRLDPPPVGTLVYGNVTLIAVVLKASNGIAQDAAGSMRFRVTRKLAPLGTGALVPTSNPADAFVDVLCAPYGGARAVNADELDLDDLAASRAVWASHNGFSAVFDQPSTVWEALGLTVQTVHAAPLPVGSRMSLIHDQVQPVRAQLFTDANIIAGSLKVNQSFDRVGTPAGVRVNWRDPTTFSPVSLLVPVGQPDYSTVDLFGCTSLAVAQEHANLAAAKRTKQRSSIEFETELEGLNILPGDRIGVAAGMVKWAQGARVESVAGSTLILSTPLVWTVNATHAVQLRDPTGAPVRVVGVTRGAADNVLVLPAAPTFTLTGAAAGQEATALSFGVQDQEVTDWTVTKITPSGTAVTVEALNYDPSIYSQAAAFTREAIAPGLLEEVLT
jgi:hypothetical protein